MLCFKISFPTNEHYIACYGPDGPNSNFYFLEKMYFKVWDNLVNQTHDKMPVMLRTIRRYCHRKPARNFLDAVYLYQFKNDIFYDCCYIYWSVVFFCPTIHDFP